MTHASLFTGIGGFDLAAEWMGWENIFHCEWVKSKQEILKRNFPESTSYGDIQQFDGRPYRGTINILSGGFPCQDISIANQSKKQGGGKNIKGERSGLWKEYARLVWEIEPDGIIFENSPMLLSRGFEVVLCDLSKLGYNVEWRLFYASQFGFPHKRERLYGMAYSKRGRWKSYIENGGILQTILPERAPRSNPLPMSIERFNRHSNFNDVRMDHGFSKELDKEVIHGFGNAVIPEIPYSIFKAIQENERKEVA